MENASKALLMAGGILIALLIISALVLMFNQISEYEKAQSSSEKNSQLVDFNKEYTQYTYDDIRGYELISVINKAIDFNKKNPIDNSIDYDKKITIKVTLGRAFANKYGVNGNLKIFNITPYEIKDSSSTFAQAITKFSALETKYTLGVMSKLSANYESIKTYQTLKKQGKSEDEIKIQGGKSIKEVAGRDITDIDLETIEKYREYSEFKNSTFRSDSDPQYDDGQIVSLSFKFIK